MNGFRIALVPLIKEPPQEAEAPKATPAEVWTSSFAGQEAGALRVLEHDGVAYRLRWSPPGSFTTGSPKPEREEAVRPLKESIAKAGAGNQEKSSVKYERNILELREEALAKETQRQVTLTQGFWILETEVTQQMWKSVMGYNPSEFVGADLPVEQVSWSVCQEFVARLNELGLAPVGARFALPTEAQWEYACRAGTTTPFYWGDSLNGDKANCNGYYSYGTKKRGEFSQETKPVQSYPANPWGLFDMHGNVAEWCEDWFGDLTSGSVTDPCGCNRGERRAIRGGSCKQEALFCRSAAREGGDETWMSCVGFRFILAPVVE